MTTDEPILGPHHTVQTVCPMCGMRVFDVKVPLRTDGAAMASPGMQVVASQLILEHEKTCRGNT
jgi:propanediol utilization protein